MSKYCVISKKSPMVGNNVSHANNKTKRRFLPNLQKTSFWSNALSRRISLRVAAAAIKTVESKGGFDNWLLISKSDNLNSVLLGIKKTILKRNPDLKTTPPARKAAK